MFGVEEPRAEALSGGEVGVSGAVDEGKMLGCEDRRDGLCAAL